MQYVRRVDFAAFKPAEFHSQRIADRSSGLDTCICIVTRVPPGTGTTSGLHVHPANQVYYVLAGIMHVQLGAEEFKVGPNQLVVIPTGMPHWNWNAGAEDEIHFELIVPSPEVGQPILTRVDSASAPSGLNGADCIRPLDDTQFDSTRFSQIVLADRTSGLDGCGIGIFRVPPGGQGPDLHVHRFDQIYYILSGTMQVQIGFETYTAGPHSLVILPAGMPHKNWNDGSEPELHINVRVPEPVERTRFDLPVHFG